MTNIELNLKLINSLPEIGEKYIEEVSWQDGNKTGSHVVYADVLVPFIKEQAVMKNELMLIKVFDFIESLLKLNDEYANEVVALSVLESLIFDEDFDSSLLIRYAKEKTALLILEIAQNIEKQF